MSSGGTEENMTSPHKWTLSTPSTPWWDQSLLFFLDLSFLSACQLCVFLAMNMNSAYDSVYKFHRVLCSVDCVSI
jgi:hypothetical protein